jgi:hypothetical protein
MKAHRMLLGGMAYLAILYLAWRAGVPFAAWVIGQ